ncbi:DoxX family protein [Flavobacterium daemonense]|uniref:DoxX family membrane protein n=1 Tax=Flavobacterium daemonense TaxID=1393049 RepID=UPI001185AE0E|nr:DoxX family membrane protein [Flavobacterium daemonense]KAF2335100.1 DoxX family membrane protein [Flavobacterium daemonense]
MEKLIKLGRFFYGIGVVALGIHQLIIKDFRSEILSPFPAWAHSTSIFPILVGIALILAGIIISGIFAIKSIDIKKVCLYLGFAFLASVITSHLPYIIMLSAEKTPDFQVWINALEALTYSGGAFVMAGSFPKNNSVAVEKNFAAFLEKFIPCGRVFYSILMIVFGLSHFAFANFIATMVPKWLPAPMFWTYFFGVVIVVSGVSIIFKILIKPIALLFALTLFLFFLFFHIPDAVANPSAGGGNEIVRAIVCLLFCGIALVIALTNDCKKQI